MSHSNKLLIFSTKNKKGEPEMKQIIGKMPMNLQFFADNGGDGGDGAEGGEQTPPTPPAGGEIVDVEALQSKAKADFLASLGVTDEDSLKGILEDHNKAVAANQSELESAQGNLTKANDKLGKETSRADAAEAKLAMVTKGVAEDNFGDVLVLANAEVAGKKAKTIDEAIDNVIGRNPQFAGESAKPKSAVVDQNITGVQASGHKINVEDLNAGRITN